MFRCTRGVERLPSDTRTPRLVQLPVLEIGRRVGLGDVVGRITSSLGIRPCTGCLERAEALNDRVVFIGWGTTPSAASAPAPRPGCWFAGTNCYVFVQTLKFCCGDGTEYTQRWGWCIGFWRAPPCRPSLG
jgi:hypothetical protein